MLLIGRAVTRHQYGIFTLVSQTSFRGQTSGGAAKCRARLRVFPHFSSGIVERAKRKRVKIIPREKGDTRRVSLSRGVIFTRLRFARSTIPEDKLGTTRSLNVG